MRAALNFFSECTLPEQEQLESSTFYLFGPWSSKHGESSLEMEYLLSYVEYLIHCFQYFSASQPKCVQLVFDYVRMSPFAMPLLEENRAER